MNEHSYCRAVKDNVSLPKFKPGKAGRVPIGLFAKNRAKEKQQMVKDAQEKIIYMGFVTAASALAMQTATDINANYWIPIVAVVSTVYTAVGGMRAVVWTDVFQCLVMLSGIVTIITKGLMVTGGFKNVMAINEDRGRLEWFNLDPNPETRMTTWGTLGLGVYFVFAGSVQQGTYQRLTATKQLKASNWVITVNVALAVLTLLLTCFMGILAFAFFGQRNCDPLLNGEVGNPNQLQGLYVQNLFKHNPGFEGFFLATINSGALRCFEEGDEGVP